MNFELMIDSLPQLFDGLWVTLQLLSVALILGVVIALPLAIIWVETSRFWQLIVQFYTTFFRGTPLLVQIFIIYYGLAQFEFIQDSVLWPCFRQPFFCACLALGLNTSAYTACIIRGAILAVPHGELEAGKAFAMTRWTLYRTIIIPQALRLVLPAYGNEVIIILKATSIASTITIMDLTGTAYAIVSRTYSPYEIFITAALIYISITFILTRLFKLVENRTNRHMYNW